MTYTRLVVFSVVAMVASAVFAQVVARQGTEPTKKFHSPMIIEVPLPNVTRHPIGGRSALGTELSDYTCDEVSLATLTVEVKKRTQRDGERIVLELAGGVHVPSSHDRLVDLAFVAKKGDTVMGKASARNISAEEDRTTFFHTPLTLDEAQLRDAFASEPHPILEMTVVVRDNS